MEQVKQTDEEFVRGAWERAEMCETVTGPYLKYSVSLGGRMFTKACVPDGWAMSEAAAWSAAAAYTRERLEEVRDLREEMNLLRGMVALLKSEPGDLTAPIYKRTIARLEAIVTGKTSGMKEGACAL